MSATAAIDDTNDGRVDFCVLGPIEVRIDGLPINIGGYRQRRLLALLLSRAGRVIATDALVEHVWDDADRPGNAVDALRTYISRLRRSVAAAGLDASALLITQPPGYRLTTDRGDVDAVRFERLVLQARSHLDGGDAVAALVGLDGALGLWRGPPYQEFADRAWIEPEVARLSELQRVAVEQRAAARLDLGAHAEVVAELEQLVAEDPLRARPVELLMLALYRSGRQAEALRVGSRYRRAVTEVGLDPPSSVSELEARVAVSDDSLRPVVASTDTIRGYPLAERIGEGSFSVVYRSVQPSLGREVAVKQIRAELANRPDFIRRFEAEAQLVAGLEHPHTVPLYDYWREPGSAYLVMRWLRGGTLETRLRRQRLDAAESVTLATQVGSALAAAHRAGVEHRDVRTANVFLDDIGNYYLGDFGIATTIDAPRRDEEAKRNGAGDIRGLGAVMYESITGKNGHASPDLSLATLRPDLPAALEGVLLRAILGGDAERYASVDRFVDDYVTAIDGTALRRSGATDVSLADEIVNPYKGLRAFQEADADDFHGRRRLVDRLLDRLAEPGSAGRLVAAVGPSGSGKSSLVRAGLLPRLRTGAVAGSDGWFITTMIPGPRPFDELEAALNRIATAPTTGLAETMAADPHGIGRAVNSTLPDERSELLVVIDQFEELFTLADDTTLRHFLDGLVAAVADPRSRTRVVITIRADHWHRPLQHPELAHLLETAAVTVTPMVADELERAITGPARRMGVTFEPGLVADVIAEVHDQPGALPLMQYLLTELFDAREGGLMQLETYRGLGGVAGGLGRRADDVYRHLDARDRDATRRLFSRLITPGEGEESRRRVPRSELAKVPAEVIDAYGAARLLTFDRDPGTRESTVEVAHEALLRDWPRLRAWLDEDRSDLRTLHQMAVAADAWETRDRDPGELARGGRLAAVTELASRRPEWLSVREDQWVASSRAAAEAADADRRAREDRARRQNRRLRGLRVAAVLLLTLAIGAAAVGLVSRNRADDARADAEIERLVAQSAAEIPTEPDLAILLALEANRRRDDPTTQTALHRAVAADPRVDSIHPDPFGGATITTLSEDGSTGVTASTADGAVVWFDGQTGEILETTYDAPSTISEVAISGDGVVTALALRTGDVVFVDRDGNEMGQLSDDDGAPLLDLALDADGDTISVSLGQGPNMLVADAATGDRLSAFALDHDRPGAFVTDLSADGARLAVGANSDGPVVEGTVMIYDTSTGERVRRWDSDRGPVTAIDLSGDTLVSGFHDGAIEIRTVPDDDDPDGASVAIPAHAGRVEAVAVIGGGRVLSAGAGEVRVWTADGAPAAVPLATTAEVLSVAATEAGRVTVARRSGGPLIADLSGGPLIEAAYSEAANAQLWPHSPYVDIPGPDFRSLRLIDLDSGETVRELDLTGVHANPIAPPFYSSDGEWIMTVELGFTVPGRWFAVTEITGDRQYLVEPVEIYRTFFGDLPGPGVFFRLRVEAGGERLFALARNDAGDVRAGWFALDSGELLAGPLDLEFGGPVLLLDDGKVAHGGFADSASLGILPPDLGGRSVVVEGTGGLTPFHQDVDTGRIVVGGPGGNVGVVDPDTATFTPIAGAGGLIYGAAFSPDGSLIAVASLEEGLQLFDADALTPLGIAVDLGLRDPGVAPDVRWTEDGSGVWVATGRGPIRIAASPDRWVDVACDIINRELTREEWATFVSAESEPAPACQT